MRNELLKTKDTFRCSELPLISALAYFGFFPECYERDIKAPDKVVAIFVRSDELNKFLENYWQKQVKVEPASFWAMVREVKGRIRAAIDYEVER